MTTVFVGGTTGECSSLTVEERNALTQRWVEVANGTAMRVVVHVGTNCLADAKALAKQAQELNVAAVAALAPNYFKPKTLDVLVEWCAEIAAAAPGLPFYFYDIPSMTGVTFPMIDFLEAAAVRIPNLAGAKFTNPDLTMFQRILHLRDGRFDVLWGTDEYLLAALTLGGAGAVGSSYNFLAPHFHRLIADYECGNLTAARAAQFQAVQVITTLFHHGYLSAAKEVLRMRGADLGGVRLPNANMNAEQTASLRRELIALGIEGMVA